MKSLWVYFQPRYIALLLMLSACGRDGFKTGTAADPEEDDAEDGTVLQCGPKTGAQLVAEEGSLNPMRSATLGWSPKQEDCSFKSGAEAPVELEGVVRFASLDGELAVYGVVPWTLEGSDERKAVAPGVTESVSLTYGDQRMRVQFTYEDGWVTLEKVTLQNLEENR